MTLKEPLEAAKPDPVPAPAPAVSAAPRDRRRPGRPDHASPHLLPLLRTTEIEAAAASGTAEEQPDEEDALSPAKGIAIGLVLSVPFWVIVAGVLWEVL